jgi:hypothetical protein
MNVFSIDIPFKGNHSHSNMRSKVTAVSMTLLCNHYLREFEAIFEKALTCVLGTQGMLFDEKKTEVENLVPGSLFTIVCIEIRTSDNV